MYTKKLLRSAWSIKEVLTLVLIFTALVFLFGFIELQDAKGNIDDLISKDGSVTQVEVDNISVFSPVSIISIVASLGFGLAFVSQLFTTSLQVNVTRKHLHKAVVISEIICSIAICATVIPARIGANLLFSKLCSGDYSPLADKFRDEAFNISIFPQNSTGVVFSILIMLFGTFALTLLGSLLMMLLSRKKGLGLFLTIAGAVIIIGVILVALALIGIRVLSVIVLSAMLVGLVLLQWVRIKKLSLENKPAGVA